MTKHESKQERRLLLFDDAHPRWYYYSFQRLPVSLIVSFVVLAFVFPLLLCLGFAIYQWMTA